MGKGAFLLSEFTVEAYAANGPSVTNKIKFRRALADAEAAGFGVTNAIDGEVMKGGWSNEFGPARRNEERRAVFECEQPITGFPGGTRLMFTVHCRNPRDAKMDSATIGRFRISATTNTGPLQVDPLSAAQRQVAAKLPSERSPFETRQLFNAFRAHDAALRQVTERIDAAYTNWPSAATTLALQKRETPRTTRVWKRGDWQRPGDSVTAGVPAVLHPLPANAPLDRLTFAKWLVDPRARPPPG